ncbi:glutathione-dependent formaldehyde-activating enzyme [Xylariaceae sp. AK1471]|nr:glutathione-dependent formaldehyde-activating enzyme [Xylariaceae sp. AK1471]
MAEQEAPLKTYRGNCHCAAFVYEITLPEIKQVTECNCSICYKKGAIFVFPKPSDVKFVKGDPSTLAHYNFNTNKFTHEFCPTCGVSLMIVGHLTPEKEGKKPENGFNVRTFQRGQVDLWTFDIKTFDGNATPSPYEAPKFTGPEPTGEVEGGKLYTGSCHCGAVTVALKSKPLNKDFQGLTECNCSSCSRYGAVWSYQPHAQVVVEGKENLGLYLFNKRAAKKRFCKICGVPVCQETVQFSEEKVAQMPENMKKWYVGAKDLTSLNLRVIHGLNVGDLNPKRFDGYNFIPPQYVEP